jgi:hypothetical protein
VDIQRQRRLRPLLLLLLLLLNCLLLLLLLLLRHGCQKEVVLAADGISDGENLRGLLLMGAHQAPDNSQALLRVLKQNDK